MLGRLALIEETNLIAAHPVTVTAGRPRRAPGAADGAARQSFWPVLVTQRGGRFSPYVTDDQVTARSRDADPQALCGAVFAPAA